MNINLDIHQSVYRERLLEHLLIGDLLKHSWLHAGATLEASQPSIDRSGHEPVADIPALYAALFGSRHQVEPQGVLEP